MLPAPHRLRRRRDFQVATRRGRRAGGATLVLHLLDDPSSGTDPARPPARVGFVVGRGCGPAVRRNRVRRRLRHLMRPALPALPAGALLVVRARPAAAGASTASLHADLARQLDRVLAAPGRSRS